MSDVNLFYEKNNYLSTIGEEYNQYDFYRYIFPKGSFENQGIYENGKANGILLTVNNKKGNNRLVFDDLQEIQDRTCDDFVVMSPISYFGKRRTSEKASMLYAFTFDIDDVALHNLKYWGIAQEKYKDPFVQLALPTFIVNSGTGIHLYYVLKQPIPLYKCNHKKLNDFKRELTRTFWNKLTSENEDKQYQSLFQGFRIVGGNTKLGYGTKVTAFKVGDRVDIDYLNGFARPEYRLEKLGYESNLTLEQAKEKYPDWYQKRIVDNAQKGRWIVKRALYDWWLNKIKTDKDLQVGHRYFCLMCLSIYARKCDIPYEELQKDALSLFDYFNSFQNDFTLDDIESALASYQESFVNFPRYEIEKISGLSIPKNKRNGRTQDLHLKLARANRDVLQAEKGTKWTDGNGRPSKKEQVGNWRKNNPNGTKAECNRDTKIDPKTIRKWW